MCILFFALLSRVHGTPRVSRQPIDLFDLLLVLGGAGGREDSGFDGHRDDDFFDQPGFGITRGGDRGAIDKFAEARFADAEELGESRARAESGAVNEGKRSELDGFFVWCEGIGEFTPLVQFSWP